MQTTSSDDIQLRQEAEHMLARARHADERARAHLILGVLREREEDWEGAISAYERCLAEDPSDPHNGYFGNNNLGFSLIQLGRFDEAEEYCLAAIEVDERRHNAHKNLGLACLGQGRWMDAAFSLLQAARLQPADPRAWRHLEQLLVDHPRLLKESSLLKAGVEDQRQLLARGGHARVH